jgi:pyruvate formate lyase activating enzyme
VLRDPNATAGLREISAQEIVDIALRQGARAVTSTYNEPLITSEWAVEVFKLAKQHGLYTSFVSNGNATQEVIDYIQPFTDFYKIDLKSFQDANYRKLGGTLKTVLDTIQRVYDNHFWLELVTLIVPTINDSEEELRDIAQFIASISVDIPWHVTAFYETYKMHGPGGTPLRTLLRAAEIGNEEGLRFVYIGNVRGSAPQWENTYCPNCHELVIERHGYHIQQNKIQDGKCQACGHSIPGVWH